MKRCRDLAVQPGNADYNKYMCGMANGLILAVAIMEGTTPEYLEPPNDPSAHKMAKLTLSVDDI